MPRPDRRLVCHYDGYGNLVMNGKFAPEVGVLIVKALEMAMEQHVSAGNPAGAATPGRRGNEPRKPGIAVPISPSARS